MASSQHARTLTPINTRRQTNGASSSRERRLPLITHNIGKSWIIQEKVRAPGFEPWWVASHWTVLPLDYKPNRHEPNFILSSRNEKSVLHVLKNVLFGVLLDGGLQYMRRCHMQSAPESTRTPALHTPPRRRWNCSCTKRPRPQSRFL
jgi:hypothetical protein